MESIEGGVSQDPEEETGHTQRYSQAERSGGGNGCLSVKEGGQRMMPAGPK